MPAGLLKLNIEHIYEAKNLTYVGLAEVGPEGEDRNNDFYLYEYKNEKILLNKELTDEVGGKKIYFAVILSNEDYQRYVDGSEDEGVATVMHYGESTMPEEEVFFSLQYSFDTIQDELERFEGKQKLVKTLLRLAKLTGTSDDEVLRAAKDVLAENDPNYKMKRNIKFFVQYMLEFEQELFDNEYFVKVTDENISLEDLDMITENINDGLGSEEEATQELDDLLKGLGIEKQEK